MNMDTVELNSNYFHPQLVEGLMVTSFGGASGGIDGGKEDVGAKEVIDPAISIVVEQIFYFAMFPLVSILKQKFKSQRYQTIFILSWWRV